MRNSYSKSMPVLKALSKYEPRSMHDNLPVIWKKAKDSFVWDINGKKYIDFTSGICVANAGHNNPNIVKSIREAELYHTYSFPTNIRAEYLKELCEFTGFDKAFLLSAGTEATECAVKIMRLNTRRKYIISFTGSMHGKTGVAENLRGHCSWCCDNEIIRLPFPNKHDLFLNILAHNYSGELEEIAGYMIESYQGWSASFYSKKFIQDLVVWARGNGSLVCFDEIQGGFGRTGKMFAYEHYDIPKPDLVCIGKGMTSSVPMSGVLGRKELLDTPDDLSSTQSGNPLCCAAGLANLKEIKRILPTIKKKEKVLFDFLNDNFKPEFINGKGLIAAILTPGAQFATEVCYRAMKKGLLLIKTDKPSIKIAPPLTISRDVLLKGLQILFESVKCTNG